MLNEQQKVLIHNARQLSPDARILNETSIQKLETELNIVLSDEFKIISKEYSYEWLGGFEWLAFSKESKFSVSSMTITLRKNYNLPNRYVCLADDGTSMILMETQNDTSKSAPVIWCSIEDMYRLANEEPMIYKPDIFNNFTDFFAFLIEKEKENQGI